jgi:hypothetical protein
MCDALSRDAPKPPSVRVLLANCLADARWQPVEVADNFLQESRHVLEALDGVYHDGRAGSGKESVSGLSHDGSAPVKRYQSGWAV